MVEAMRFAANSTLKPFPIIFASKPILGLKMRRANMEPSSPHYLPPWSLERTTATLSSPAYGSLPSTRCQICCGTFVIFEIS